MEAVFRLEIARIFFRWVPVKFPCFLVGTGRKSSEKIRKFSGRNTASTKSLELPGTDSFRTGLFNLDTLGFFALVEIITIIAYLTTRNREDRSTSNQNNVQRVSMEVSEIDLIESQETVVSRGD
jgi:hypothetical protein